MEFQEVQPTGNYVLHIQASGIGSPLVYIVNKITRKNEVVMYANDYNLNQAIIKATAIAALMNAGLSADEACQRWN